MLDATPDWLHEIDHTGDIGIKVEANTLSELFERAAWGMFSVLTDPDTVRPDQAHAVSVEADDRDELMVRWLSELNYLHVTQHQLFSKFAIDELGSTHLAATAWGEPIDADRHTVYTEIKAITYHQMEIAKTEDGWHVQIIFDM